MALAIPCVPEKSDAISSASAGLQTLSKQRVNPTLSGPQIERPAQDNIVLPVQRQAVDERQVRLHSTRCLGGVETGRRPLPVFGPPAESLPNGVLVDLIYGVNQGLIRKQVPAVAGPFLPEPEAVFPRQFPDGQGL